MRYRRRFRGIDIHPSANILAHGGVFDYTQGNAVGEHSSIILTERSRIYLGKGSWVGKDVLIEPIPGGAVVINDRSSIQDRCRLIGEVTIGANVLLAPNVFISSGNHFYDVEPYAPIRYQDGLVHSNTQYEALRSQEVVIEDDCWIGTNVVIMRGVRIGKGAIIGANAVVTRDIDPYWIAGGIPAKKLKPRFNFVPPSYINVTIKEHWPFFYSGLLLETQNGSSLMRMGKDFVVCLKPAAETAVKEISLQVDARQLPGGTVLQYNGHAQTLQEGIHKYIFPAGAATDGMYSFTITFPAAADPGQITLYLAEAGLQ